MQRRKKENKTTLLLLTGLLLIFVFLGYFFYHSNQSSILGPYYCSYVYDGDTIQVVIDGQETKVRIIGVDTPEMDDPDEKVCQQAQAAKQYTSSLVEEKEVYLQADKDLYDKYGRSLYYVYLSDGTTMLEKLLLENGYGSVLIIQPNDRYQLQLEAWQANAKGKKLGIWQ